MLGGQAGTTLVEFHPILGANSIISTDAQQTNVGLGRQPFALLDQMDFLVILPRLLLQFKLAHSIVQTCKRLQTTFVFT
jgi:hypothetical protein